MHTIAEQNGRNRHQSGYNFISQIYTVNVQQNKEIVFWVDSSLSNSYIYATRLMTGELLLKQEKHSIMMVSLCVQLLSDLLSELFWDHPSYPSSSSQVNHPTLQMFLSRPAQGQITCLSFTCIMQVSSLHKQGFCECLNLKWFGYLASLLSEKFFSCMNYGLALQSYHQVPKLPLLISKIPLGWIPNKMLWFLACLVYDLCCAIF